MNGKLYFELRAWLSSRKHLPDPEKPGFCPQQAQGKCMALAFVRAHLARYTGSTPNESVFPLQKNVIFTGKLFFSLVLFSTFLW